MRSWVRHGARFALLLLLTGCQSQALVTLEFLDGQISRAQLDPRSTGRSCFTVEVTDSDEVAVTYAVDASSDWAGFRALEAVLPGVVTAAVQGVALAMAPVSMIGQLLGYTPPEAKAMQSPSSASACTAVLDD